MTKEERYEEFKQHHWIGFGVGPASGEELGGHVQPRSAEDEEFCERMRKETLEVMQ